MDPIYVVRRPFKSQGILFEAGVVVDDPNSIKLFRSRLGSRDVVELSEGSSQNQMWYEYLTTRAKMPLDDRILVICGLKEATTAVETPVTETPEPIKVEAPVVETPAPVKVEAPAKAVKTVTTVKTVAKKA